MDFLTLAIAKLNIKPSQVVDYKTSDTDIIILINYGIAGVKKFIFTASDFDVAEVEAKKVDDLQTKLTGRRGKRG